jgi:hypothetical protein
MKGCPFKRKVLSPVVKVPGLLAAAAPQHNDRVAGIARVMAINARIVSSFFI